MNTQEVRNPTRKTIMIQAHQVTLFAEHPNPKVAEQVKRALLSGISMGKVSRHGK